MRKNLLVWAMLILCGCGGSDGDSGGGSGGTGGGFGGNGGSSVGCSAATCPAGCCLNNLCQAGNTVTACGKGGRACGTCESFELCGSNVCATNPDSLWTVTAVSAKFDTTIAWDLGGGAPDGYACFVSPPGAATGSCTAAVANSFNPVWNTVLKSGVKASLLKSTDWGIYCLDDDISEPDSAGYVSGLTDDVLRDGGGEGDTQEGCKLTVKVAPQ